MKEDLILDKKINKSQNKDNEFRNIIKSIGNYNEKLHNSIKNKEKFQSFSKNDKKSSSSDLCHSIKQLEDSKIFEKLSNKKNNNLRGKHLNLSQKYCKGLLEDKKNLNENIEEPNIQLMETINEVTEKNTCNYTKQDNSKLKAVAIFDYFSDKTGELSFNKGDILQIEMKEGRMWKGILKEKTGLIPHNYVKINSLN